jgi:nitroimidazol reductase NimA-like FMN-containing flavoprotein (pyridoxamine 5'-phosphate oxidase superfamily)
MTIERAVKDVVTELLDTQFQGVLATQNRAQPYTSLMAFGQTADLKKLLIVTLRGTQKHENLLTNPLVSFLIDNRQNATSDYADAVAVSVCGRASEVSMQERAHLQNIFLKKNCTLESFTCRDDCALMQIEVDVYFVIRRFLEVSELRPA